jgi:multicomponent Na+:H+ antiporter subunit C
LKNIYELDCIHGRMVGKRGGEIRSNPRADMEGERMLEAFTLATILAGFFGIVFKKNLVMKILSMDVMSTGVIAYCIVIAARQGLFTPIVGQTMTQPKGAFADPVPQAVILTAIVIGLSIQALMLVGVMKLAQDNPTLETSEIEKNSTP